MAIGFLFGPFSAVAPFILERDSVRHGSCARTKSKNWSAKHILLFWLHIIHVLTHTHACSCALAHSQTYQTNNEIRIMIAETFGAKVVGLNWISSISKNNRTLFAISLKLHVVVYHLMQLFICSVSLVFWLSTPFYISIILLRILILAVQPQLFIRFLPAHPKVEWQNFNHILAWGLTVRGNVQSPCELLCFSFLVSLTWTFLLWPVKWSYG